MEGPLERLELQQNGLRNVSGLEGAEIQELLLQDSHGQPKRSKRTFQGVIDEMIFIELYILQYFQVQLFYF